MKKLAVLLLLSLIASEGIGEQLTSSNVYFGNLHSHTAISDGTGTPSQAYDYARFNAQLDFLAITEHNHKYAPSILQDNPEAYQSQLVNVALERSVPGKFVALYGQEFSSISKGNHANVLDVDKVILSEDVPNGRWDLLLDVWLKDNKASDGEPAILLLNHPSQSSSPNSQEYGFDDYPGKVEHWREHLNRYASLFNIVNGPSHTDSGKPGRPSESEFKRYLNMGFYISPTADQDNHLANWGTAATTRTGVIATALTKKSILHALRARHVYATEDKNLRLVGKVNNHLFGKVFTADESPNLREALEVQLEIFDEDEPYANYKVEVYSDVVNGREVADIVKTYTFTGNGVKKFKGLRYDAPGQYFFFIITQSDSDFELHDKAWLAPFWFEGKVKEPVQGTAKIQMELDKKLEQVVLTNFSDVPQDLTGWKLVSENGDQKFIFNNFILESGRSVQILSGAAARTNEQRDNISWTRSYVWNNDNDRALLYSADGQLIATAL